MSDELTYHMDFSGVKEEMKDREYHNVGFWERVGCNLAGGFLLGAGLARPNGTGLTSIMLGGALIYRGSTGHCSARAAMTKLEDKIEEKKSHKQQSRESQLV